MGGDPIRIEPSEHDEILNNQVMWKLFVEEGLDHFVMACNGYDQTLSEAIVDSREEGNYSYNNINFNISLKIVFEAIHMPNEGRLIQREEKEKNLEAREKFIKRFWVHLKIKKI